MSEGGTYLELSQEGGGAHKFYEVMVRGTMVSVRYGRIGAGGQQQTSTFPTGEKAGPRPRGRSARRSARATHRRYRDSGPPAR